MDILQTNEDKTSWNCNSFVVGTILADAYVNKFVALTVEHALKQKEYVWWKYAKFASCGFLAPPSTLKTVTRVNKKTKKNTQSLRFFTKSLFKEQKKLFYDQNVKIVPSNLFSIIDAQSLAVWFMDDGGKGGNSVQGLVVVDVSSFTPLEHALIQRVLLDKFHLKTSLHFYSKKAVKLYIKAESAKTFYTLVNLFIAPCMRYKLERLGVYLEKIEKKVASNC